MNQARMRVMRDSELTRRLQDERLKYKDIQQEKAEYKQKMDSLFVELERLKKDFEEAINEAHEQRDSFYKLILDLKAERDSLIK